MANSPLQTFLAEPEDFIKKARLDVLLTMVQTKFPQLGVQSLQQHDTFEISQLYLQRPQSMAHVRMSDWFCLAYGLDDWNLQQAASLGDFKQQLISKCYVYLPLEVLREFNQMRTKQGEKA